MAGQNVWDGFSERIGLVIDQIKESEGWENGLEEFNSEGYKKRLSAVLKALGHEATKLSLCFSKPPLPSDKEVESILTSAEKTAVALLSVYSKLPKSSGLTLRKAIRSTVTESVEGLRALIDSIKNGGAGSPEQLQTTGLVWEETDKHFTLPKDNCEAACHVIDRNVPLIDDAHSELTEALNCDEDDEDGLNDFLGITENSGENDHKWTESDRNMIQFCLGLVKCSKNIVKKCKTPLETRGKCDKEDNIRQMDTLVDLVERLSPVVDELATCVYPPFRMSVVEKRAADLKQMNKDILDFIRTCHFITEDDAKWLEFLRRANKHNYNKIHTFLLTT